MKGDEIMKHITTRFAWHDSKWNGRICENPRENVYCIDNYSLLSARIQRRRNIDIEEKYRGKPISEIKKDYTPPCYWCINALGEKKYKVKDPHPLGDKGTGIWKKLRTDVPPLKEELKPFSIFTWNFKIPYVNKPAAGGYPPDLEERVKKYIKNIEPAKSIVFFYANYGNPITEDERKYLVLGAGLIKEKAFPKEYEIPRSLYEKLNRSNPNFPKIAWRFQISLDPDFTFILPYHDYLEALEEGKIEEEKLDEIAVKVDEPTIEPHFKYVSMHLTHDKAIYLLYKLRKSIDKIKKHGIIPSQQIEDYNEKVEKLLKIAWRERGQYPGFENLLAIFLKNEFKNDKIEQITEKLKNSILKNFGSLDNFMSSEDNLNHLNIRDPDLKTAVDIIRDKFELFSFLARFDFSKKQFKNLLKDSEKGLHNFKSNPYSILEWYSSYEDKDWDIDNNDFGISVYNLDIALIPDTKYANWDRLYNATSPERISALITFILSQSAQDDGHSYLPRHKIIEEIKNYPLYYIQQDFQINEFLLSQYENNPKFKENFDVISIDNQVIYQLKSLRKAEQIIEKFIREVEKGEYKVSSSIVRKLVEKDMREFRNKLDRKTIEHFKKEREELYFTVLRNKLSVVTGRAGTGKTTAIVRLVELFQKQGKTPIYIFTPTGKASLVIRKRLKNVLQSDKNNIEVSTIHRFLYRYRYKRGEEITALIPQILEHKRYEKIEKIQHITEVSHDKPKVVIIDEASMADEILLSLLFSLFSPSEIQNIIIVGDDGQLPPIGVGRPFIDLIYYLKNQGFENKIAYLTTDLRFPKYANIGKLAELFRENKEPLPEDLKDFLSNGKNKKDRTLELSYFQNIDDLKKKLRDILNEVRENKSKQKKKSKLNLKELFDQLFKQNGKFSYENLEKVQIITPKRVGTFGSNAINWVAICEGESEISRGSKIICEENQYMNIGGSRELILANGSIGYLDEKKELRFAEIDELPKNEYEKDRKRIKEKLREKLNQEAESPFTLGYSITVHKSQGSDFDYVIFVLSEKSKFITRELLYTAFTRARKKLYFLVHNDLKDDLYNLVVKAHSNSKTASIYTLLFGHKQNPFKPYMLKLRNNKTISVRSKIEYIIAKTLDSLGIEFEYEPELRVNNMIIKPDFKIHIGGREFYWEHLGLLDKEFYKNRWFRKYEIYRKIGLEDSLITTSETKEPKDIENQIKNIIADLKNKPKITKSNYSKHHYEL